MKIVTILGTRPEIIRLRSVIDVLDQIGSHVLVHTGQNFDDRLSRVFFIELGLREPDYQLGIASAKWPSQIGQIIPAVADVLHKERPDALLVLGDTNSGLSSIVAKRMGIPVFHMEAGNRCFDDRVPEEVNRRIIDHCSSYLMPYTHRSKENLLAEGIERRRIFVIGNPIHEVLDRFKTKIEASTIVDDLGLTKDDFFLVTAHRAETVDDPERLRSFARSLEYVERKWGLPLICSLHPRTAERMAEHRVRADNISFTEPLGFSDFVALEQAARCVLTDSGTVQEECCILGIPSVTLRSVTERPETIECGSNVLAGVSPDEVIPSIEQALRRSGEWKPPPEYLQDNVSDIVGRTIVSCLKSEGDLSAQD